MHDSGPLPYVDLLLDALGSRTVSVEKSFGRHIHWGYWDDPDQAPCDDEDYGRAAERLTLELCAAAQVSRQERVLDAGCGFGGTVASLNERFTGMSLVGLNIDGRQLARAHAQVLPLGDNHISFSQGDACNLPFADRTFDRVLAVECIFHFPSRERFFAEAFRVLRPGGTLSLSDFVPAASFRPFARLATEARPLERFQYFGRCNLRHDIARYRALASHAGFVSLVERNVTRHTLPTYRYLRRLLRDPGVGASIPAAAGAMVRGIEWIAALDLVQYYLMAFRKPVEDRQPSV